MVSRLLAGGPGVAHKSCRSQTFVLISGDIYFGRHAASSPGFETKTKRRGEGGGEGGRVKRKKERNGKEEVGDDPVNEIRVKTVDRSFF